MNIKEKIDKYLNEQKLTSQNLAKELVGQKMKKVVGNVRGIEDLAYVDIILENFTVRVKGKKGGKTLSIKSGDEVKNREISKVEWRVGYYIQAVFENKRTLKIMNETREDLDIQKI